MNLLAMATRLGGTFRAEDLVQGAHLAMLANPTRNNFRCEMINLLKYENRHHPAMLSLDAPRQIGGERGTFADLVSDGKPTPLAELLTKENQARVKQLVEGLGPRDQNFIQLHYYAEMSLQEIANLWGVSYGAIKLTHHRAIKRLSALARKQ